MSNEKLKPIYFQTPKIMTDHPKITGDHIYIFMPLYDQLRQSSYDKTGYNETNEYLHEFSKVVLRQLKTKLNQLEEWGFLIRKGIGHNRKFFLGDIFNNSAEKEPVQEYNNGAESELVQCEKGTSTGRKRNYIAKNINKNIDKKDFFNSKPQKPKHPLYTEEENELVLKYKHGLKYPAFQLEGIILEKAKILYKRHNYYILTKT